MKKLNKKGVFDQLSGIVIGLVVLAVVLIVGFLIYAQLAANTAVVADGNATAAVASLQTSTEDVVDWIPIVVIVIIGALLIGLVGVFGRRR